MGGCLRPETQTETLLDHDVYEEDVDHDVVEEEGLMDYDVDYGVDYDVDYGVDYDEFEEDMDY